MSGGPRSNRLETSAAAEQIPTTVALVGIGLFVSVLVTFWPALSADFLTWDDPGMVLNNEHFRGFDAERLRWMFTTGLLGHYQPLAWMSLAMDHALWGLKPSGYHLTSVLLHALNTMLVALLADVLLRIAAATAAAPAPRTLMSGAASTLAALLFGLHPMRVESVVWITERRDVLSTFFALLCVLAYVRYACFVARSDRGAARWWYVVALGMMILVLLSKAIGVVLPCVLLALDWYPLRRLRFDSGLWRSPSQRRVWLEKIPYMALAVVFTAVILNIQHTYFQSMEEHTLPARMAQAAYAVGYYLWATVAPLKLLPLYELQIPLEWMQFRFILSMVGVAALAVIMALAARKRPGFVVALVAYLAMILPVSGVLQNGPQLVADRYSYIAIIGVVIVTAAAWSRWSFAQPAWGRAVCLALAAGAVVCFAVATWRYATAWQTSEQLWSYTLERQEDHAVAHSSLGTVRMDQQRLADAMQHYRRALELRPDLFEPAYNLSRALFMNDRPAEAEEVLRRSLAHHPDNAQLRWLLADCLLWRDAWAEAAENYTVALRTTPDSAAMHANLGLALSQMGRIDQAIEHLQQAVSLRPERVQSHVSLARLLWTSRGDAAGARRYLEDALRRDPRNPAARELLAQIDQSATQPTR